ncbi:HAMP domain-containing histidine kinase [Flavobacterium sp. CBA20B-1]|uniref:sensor histidine kinase n=1 Tax=unclassified Flavobacterium TaxID=196869 RepID=UPI00222505E3|nr:MULTISPECIES: HAMP domain-containing sensor histidine kinase [unclassified Flavobacterium]WCM42372.1 HAMP domain-containing histidine kinase [Flavobacterium sp. CBA20B-1]
MNKYRFQFLIVLMSLALLGIILIQLYWISASYQNNDIQFQHLVNQTIGKVADKVKEKERYAFNKKFYEYQTKTGKAPDKKAIKEIFYIEKDNRTNQEIVYSNIISVENIKDFNFGKTFIDSASGSKKDYKNYISSSKTEIYKGKEQPIDGLEAGVHRSLNTQSKPDEVIKKEENVVEFFDIYYNDIVSTYPIEERLDNKVLQSLLKQELANRKLTTNFEYAVFNNGLETSVKSGKFVFNDNNTYSVPILTDLENRSKYQLYISFPQKSKFLVSDLLPFILISLLFTIVIIAAYYSAIRQLITQRQISEIKNDFINNMTHEFKTPIATINLALDAIKNPKIISDEEKVLRYVQMIRDENKRMHAQIENILRISKLEKKELDIPKEKVELTEVLEVAIDHVSLLIEDREGELNTHFNTTRDTVLINPTHFTSVFVNILDNAIKYSPNAPVIDIYTENVKDTIIVRIKDKGAGMSKAATKKIFDKFYREHTGDLHNVKGHGLGLAYVKQIVDDHNAQVYVESEKGKGSTFIIKIPLIN